MKNPKGSVVVWALLILLVVIVAGAGYWWIGQSRPAYQALNQAQSNATSTAPQTHTPAPTDPRTREAIEFADHTFTWIPAADVQDPNEVQFSTANGAVTNTVFLTTHVTFAGADPNTFVVAVHPDGTVTSFAKDANHVYDTWNGMVVAGADPQTFSVLADLQDDPEGDRGTFAKDENHVYVASADAYPNGIIAEADAATFVYVGQGILKDKNQLYTIGNGNPNTSLVKDIASFVWVGGPWFKDDSQGYCGNGGQEPPLAALPVDVPTFKGLSDYYAKDSQHVYFYSDLIASPCEVLAGADPSTFTVVSGQSTYDAQDKDHTYLRGKVVQ